MALQHYTPPGQPAVYVRVPFYGVLTDGGLSADAQRVEAWMYAAASGYMLYSRFVFVDMEPGHTLARQALRRMLEQVDAGNVCAVFTWQADRLATTRAVALAIWGQLEARRIPLYVVARDACVRTRAEFVDVLALDRIR